MSNTCPYCRELIDDSAGCQCPGCGTPHHIDCWQENAGCTVFGCSYLQTDDAKISIAGEFANNSGQGNGANDVYFLSRGGVQYGPYTETELRSFIHSGNVGAGDMVWNPGLPTWIPVTEIAS